MNGRVAFFLVASAAGALLVPVSPAEYRWVAVAVAVTYAVLAALAALEALSRRR